MARCLRRVGTGINAAHSEDASGRWCSGALLTSGIASSARARNRSHHWAHHQLGYSAIPQRTLEGLMAQLSLTSAQLGEKYHGARFASFFSGMAALMCERLTSSRFNNPLVNLPFPSAFRVVWDGITLKNGATVIPIIVVVTDYVGRIVSELVDAPISQGSSGVDVVALVHGVLERKTSLSNKVVFTSRSSGSSQGAFGRAHVQPL